jgi:hypothetical protein
MRNYRSLCQFLRREYSQFRLSIRRVPMGSDYGKCNLVGGTFYIAIDHSLCEGGAILCVLHEMAHVLSWHEDHAKSQHGRAFGLAYHQVWESYLRYLGRSARKCGIGMAAAKKKSAGAQTSAGLRSRLLAKAGEFSKKRKTLFEQLEELAPAEAAEIRQLISDWKSGNAELRHAYPSVRCLSRALASESLPIQIGDTTWRNLIEAA